MSIHRTAFLITALLPAYIAGIGVSNASEPSGLYFHQFEGSFDGTEWSTWGQRPSDNRYEFSDLTSAGTFSGTIAENGTIQLDNAQGTGAFTSDDEAFIDFTISGGFNFHSEMRRAPHTDDRFPVFMRDSQQGDTALSGQWEAHISVVDPWSGNVLETSSEQFEVLIEDDTIRLTDESGTFYQGVWFEDDQAGFRVIHPRARIPRYRTFEGSETNLDRDIIADLRLLDDGSMTFALFDQTRVPVGSQEQQMRYIELTRVPSPSAMIVLATGGLVITRRRR